MIWAGTTVERRRVNISCIIYIYIVATFSIREGVVDIPDGKPKWAGLDDQSDLIEDTDSPPQLNTALKKKKKWKREDNEGTCAICNTHSTTLRFFGFSQVAIFNSIPKKTTVYADSFAKYAASAICCWCTLFRSLFGYMYSVGLLGGWASFFVLALSILALGPFSICSITVARS